MIPVTVDASGGRNRKPRASGDDPLLGPEWVDPEE